MKNVFLSLNSTLTRFLICMSYIVLKSQLIIQNTNLKYSKVSLHHHVVVVITGILFFNHMSCIYLKYCIQVSVIYVFYLK